MHSVVLNELTKGVVNARRIAVAANSLFRFRLRTRPHYLPKENIEGAVIEILLKLLAAGGKAPLTSLTVRDTNQTLAILEEMEKGNLVKILKTPFRTYIVITERGREAMNELIRILT